MKEKYKFVSADVKRKMKLVEKLFQEKPLEELLENIPDYCDEVKEELFDIYMQNTERDIKWLLDN